MVAELSEFYWIFLLFFLIALVYSSVGFGGGSSYLAILALTGLTFYQIRSIALLCNIVVVLGNVMVFWRESQYDLKKVIPIVALSVPAAFVGGLLNLEQSLYYIILGLALFAASLFMWFSKDLNKDQKIKNKKLNGGIVGTLIGFLSGMVGIGGGIFLAPLLHLSHWDTPKKIAAVSSLFILANSISGLLGHTLNTNFKINWSLTLFLIFSVFLGSFMGNRFRNKLLSPVLLKKVTAILICFVAIRILHTHIF